MEKQTVFIKRYPSKVELPKKDGRYITNKGLTTMYKLNEGWGKRTSMGGWQSLRIEFWFEEIELPSEEELEDHLLNHRVENRVSVKRGMNFILNKLKGEAT